MPLEHRDLLLRAVIEDFEILFAEFKRGCTLPVFHGHQQADQVYVGSKDGFLRERRAVYQGCSEQRAAADHAFNYSSHSPSTHTVPSSKYAFFQIGTVR